MQVDAVWTAAIVRRIDDPAEDIRLIELEPAGGAHAYPLGAHLNVQVLIDDKPSTRSYSLVGEAPVEGVWRIAVKRLKDSRGGSRYMWGLQPGARLRISAPASHFPLGTGRAEYLLVAGGIGVTPILGMAQALSRQNAKFRMLYAGRTRDALPFVDELSRQLSDRLDVYIDAEGRFIDLTAEIAKLHPEGELYICGPIGLMEAAKRVWQQSGRPTDRLRLETFGSSGHRPAEAFHVTVQDHGRDLMVAPDVSLLDALASAGIEVAYECLRGECGLCMVDLLNVAGELDHRDIFLSATQKAEAKRLCACVSRAAGRITIDTGYRPLLGRR